jgi:precorrin-2 dehydrogenase/sirohydrochlorin ferrochelatase
VSFYPILLNVQEKSVVIIGGGEVAMRKVNDLLEAGAVVRVISPEIHPEIESLAARHEGRIDVVRRRYLPGDLAGSRLAFSATNSPETNRAVFHEAEERGIFLNAVDDPPHCSFIVPSTFRRGSLIVAVSTGGASPAMAAKLRRRIEESLPGDVEEVLDSLARARDMLKEHADFANLPSSRRGALLKRIVANDDLVCRLVDSDRRGALADFLKTLAEYQD